MTPVESINGMNEISSARPGPDILDDVERRDWALFSLVEFS
jgi:hypothetical protein